jgi:phosphoglycolate phosphatase
MQLAPDKSALRRVLLPQADAYVFDIDGTLLIAKGLVHWNAFRQAMLEVYGVEATIDGIPYHGMTDLSILRAAVTRAGVDEKQFTAALPAAIESMNREVEINRSRIVPQVCTGIVRLLESLHREGKLLGVASGNLENIGWAKIEAAGLRSFFSFGSFSDRAERRADIFRSAREQVEQKLGTAARTLFIGDTPSDVHAAREIGAPILSVSTGTFSFDELSALSPDVCVAHCGEFFSE